jgi:hypothetical protein
MVKEGQTFFVSSAYGKPDLMDQFYFMAVFSADEMTRYGIAAMDSYKRIEEAIMKEVSQGI